MNSIEDVLTEKTFKHQGLDLMRRVFYTLIGEPNTPGRAALQADRNSKAIAVLIWKLHESRLLSDAQVDEMLLDVVS